MVDINFARVLNCPHLVHIEGLIKKVFELKFNDSERSIQPSSLVDIFEPSTNINCFLVKLDDELPALELRPLSLEQSCRKIR